MSFQGAQAFAGNMSVESAYSMLQTDARAVLVDVRTQPEWQFVGVPDLSSVGKAPISRNGKSIPPWTWTRTSSTRSPRA